VGGVIIKPHVKSKAHKPKQGILWELEAGLRRISENAEELKDNLTPGSWMTWLENRLENVTLGKCKVS